MAPASTKERITTPAASRSWLREVVVGYACLLLWITLSACLIIYNKLILFELAFPYPVTLTMLHMAGSAVLSFLLVSARVVEPAPMTWAVYESAVLPISLLYSAVLALSNATYMHLSVSFIQMLKALTSASVYLVAVVWGVEAWSVRMLVNMALIVIGVSISAYGELDFSWLGVSYQLAAIALESVRLTMTQLLLQGHGVKLNPITTLYFVAPACFVGLVPLFFAFEFHQLRADTEHHATVAHLVANSATAFGLNCASFLLIGKTSALTMNVGGVVKDWVLIGLSVAIFHNTVTPINLGGYALAFLSVSWYNYQKVAEKRAAAALAVVSGPNSGMACCGSSSGGGSSGPGRQHSSASATESLLLSSSASTKVSEA